MHSICPSSRHTPHSCWPLARSTLAPLHAWTAAPPPVTGMLQASSWRLPGRPLVVAIGCSPTAAAVPAPPSTPLPHSSSSRSHALQLHAALVAPSAAAQRSPQPMRSSRSTSALARRVDVSDVLFASCGCCCGAAAPGTASVAASLDAERCADAGGAASAVCDIDRRRCSARPGTGRPRWPGMLSMRRMPAVRVASSLRCAAFAPAAARLSLDRRLADVRRFWTSAWTASDRRLGGPWCAASRMSNMRCRSSPGRSIIDSRRYPVRCATWNGSRPALLACARGSWRANLAASGPRRASERS
eukprot:366226-Chlamydomonas_euryale.AAC.17